VHAGRILISKPGYEHVAGHIDGQPDITTVFEFTTDFFRAIQEQYKPAAWFLKNNDIHSLLLQSNPNWIISTIASGKILKKGMPLVYKLTRW
jgi:hypothetical protein